MNSLGGIIFRTGTTNDGWSSATERMRITSDGTVGIGFTLTSPSSSYKLDVNGGIQCSSFNNTSDNRIKFNQTTLNGATSLSIINQLQPKNMKKFIKFPKVLLEPGFLLMPTGNLLKIIILGLLKQD